jgi:hypothetical protein
MSQEYPLPQSIILLSEERWENKLHPEAIKKTELLRSEHLDYIPEEGEVVVAEFSATDRLIDPENVLSSDSILEIRANQFITNARILDEIADRPKRTFREVAGAVLPPGDWKEKNEIKVSDIWVDPKGVTIVARPIVPR